MNTKGIFAKIENLQAFTMRLVDMLTIFIELRYNIDDKKGELIVWHLKENKK